MFTQRDQAVSLAFHSSINGCAWPHGPYNNPSVFAVRSVHDPVGIASESQAVHVIVAVHRDGARRNGVVCQVINDLGSLFYEIGTRKAFDLALCSTLDSSGPFTGPHNGVSHFPNLPASGPLSIYSATGRRRSGLALLRRRT